MEENKQMNMNIIKAWPSVSEYLSIPRNESAYKKLIKLLDSLTDEIGNNEEHPASSLMETLGLLIAEYEKNHYPYKEKSGTDILKYLMNEHNVRQSDLKEIGSQGVISEILNGKRSLNVRQIKLLANLFNVSPTVFLA